MMAGSVAVRAARSCHCGQRESWRSGIALVLAGLFRGLRQVIPSDPLNEPPSLKGRQIPQAD
jgi:hypothetical protein